MMASARLFLARILSCSAGIFLFPSLVIGQDANQVGPSFDEGVKVPPQEVSDATETTLEVRGALISGCMSKGSYYESVGTPRLLAAGPFACQALCQGNIDCVHFSYWPDGGCHLTGNGAKLRDGSLECKEKFKGQLDHECAGELVIAGSRECGSGFADLYPASDSAANAAVAEGVREEANMKGEKASLKEMSDSNSELRASAGSAGSFLLTPREHLSSFGKAFDAIEKNAVMIAWGCGVVAFLSGLVTMLYVAGYIGGGRRLKSKRGVKTGSKHFDLLPQDELETCEAAIPSAADLLPCETPVPILPVTHVNGQHTLPPSYVAGAFSGSLAADRQLYMTTPRGHASYGSVFDEYNRVADGHATAPFGAMNFPTYQNCGVYASAVQQTKSEPIAQYQ